MRMWVITAVTLALTGPMAPAPEVRVRADGEAQAGFQLDGEHLNRYQRPFSGLLTIVDDSGRPLQAGAYVNGLRDGRWETWYANGQRQATGTYVAGRRTGRHDGWWPNGQPKSCSDFANDVYDGEVRDWDQEGHLVRRAHYVAGQEQGLQQLWRADGTVFASYTVTNGRIYGLYGSKSCAAR